MLGMGEASLWFDGVDLWDGCFNQISLNTQNVIWDFRLPDPWDFKDVDHK